MNALLFWFLAVVVITASVLVISHRVMRTAVAACLVVTAGLAGLYVQLDAPWLALTLVVVQTTAVIVAALPLWIRNGVVPVAEYAPARDVAAGFFLALLLIVELAWILQRLRPAPFPPDVRTADETGAGVVLDLHGSDLLLPVLGVVVVLMSLAAVQALRREAR